MGWPTWLLTAAGLKIFKGGDIHDADTGFRVNGLGASGKVLRGDGTNFISASPRSEDLVTTYRFRAHKNADQTLAGTGVAADVPFQTEDYDPSNNYASPSFTAPVTGIYDFKCLLTISTGAFTGPLPWAISFAVNGTEIFRSNQQVMPGLAYALSITTEESLTAGDTVKITSFQSTGVNATLNGAAASLTMFSGHLKST